MELKRVPGLIGQMLKARDKDDKPVIRQAAEIMYLTASGTLAPDQYYDYQLHKSDVKTIRGLPYLGSRAYRELDLALNPLEWDSLQRNKWLFGLHFKQLGFPVPEMYGFFDRCSGITSDGLPLRNAGHLDELLRRRSLDQFVVKPVFGGMGKGLKVLSVLGGGAYTSLSGNKFDLESLTDFMSNEPYLIQERVFPHPVLEAISPGILNCYRIVTFRDRQGETHIHRCHLRLGRQGSDTDNRAGGGLGVKIDLASGTLGEGLTKKEKVWQTRHPDTGMEFSGVKMPLWHETIELALAAARACPLGSLGWDIALSVSGPVLIECNRQWEFKKAQTLGGYLRPEVREQLAEYGIKQK